MNTQRLQQLVNFLETIPDDRFNLSFWRSGGHEKLTHNCDTVACAVGWGCACPELMAQGFSFDVGMNQPFFDGQHSWEAVENFFGLSEYQTMYLFEETAYPQNYRTNLPTVIKRIKDFIASGGDTP